MKREVFEQIQGRQPIKGEAFTPCYETSELSDFCIMKHQRAAKTSQGNKCIVQFYDNTVLLYELWKGKITSMDSDGNKLVFDIPNS